MSTADYLKIRFFDEDHAITDEHVRILPFASGPMYKSKIVDAKQLTSGVDVKRTYTIAIDIENIEHEFQPGDTIGILPENDLNEVEFILEQLGLTAVSKKSYQLEILEETSQKNAAIPRHIPKQSTLLELFLKYLDIRTPPKKLFLKMLLRFTGKQNETDKLRHLTMPSASAEYFDFIKNHSSLLNILVAFPSCLPPVERILENLGPLQPRPYSICSSPLTKQLRIAFSVIELNNVVGICSGWLEKLANTFKKQDLDCPLRFYFRKSGLFRLPDDRTTPIIMIGPGTGIAPFIGFLQHRQLEKHEDDVASAWLFYGCRYLNRDFLFKPEIEEYVQDGVLTKLLTCSSRDGSNKTYVQDLIRENSKSFVEQVVNNKAVVYVCGDAKNMAKDVKSTIANCIKEHMEWSEVETNLFVKQLQDNHQYIEDVWF